MPPWNRSRSAGESPLGALRSNAAPGRSSSCPSAVRGRGRDASRFRALPAPTAADALRLCHYNDPDLLLLDLRLPDASGLDVLREIRASVGPTGRFDPVLPVIVLSGRSTDVDRVRGFA